MFIRKKKNRSGTTSVVVAEKVSGKMHELCTIGTSSNELEINSFYLQAKEWIDKHSGQDSLDFEGRSEEESAALLLLDSIQDVLINGTELFVQSGL